MYNEIYCAVKDIVDKKRGSNVSKEEVNIIRDLLKVAYTAGDSIVDRVRVIESFGGTNVVLVAGTLSNRSKIRLIDHITFRGKPSKVVWFDDNLIYKAENKTECIVMLMRNIFTATNYPAERFIKEFDMNDSNIFGVIVYYAPAIIASAVVLDIYNYSEEIQTIIYSVLLSLYSNDNITVEFVDIVHSMLMNDSVEDLLDNSKIFAVQSQYNQDKFWLSKPKNDKPED